jgi:hypothetical protein
MVSKHSDYAPMAILTHRDLLLQTQAVGRIRRIEQQRVPDEDYRSQLLADLLRELNALAIVDLKGLVDYEQDRHILLCAGAMLHYRSFRNQTKYLGPDRSSVTSVPSRTYIPCANGCVCSGLT